MPGRAHLDPQRRLDGRSGLRRGLSARRSQRDTSTATICTSSGASTRRAGPQACGQGCSTATSSECGVNTGIFSAALVFLRRLQPLHQQVLLSARHLRGAADRLAVAGRSCRRNRRTGESISIATPTICGSRDVRAISECRVDQGPGTRYVAPRPQRTDRLPLHRHECGAAVETRRARDSSGTKSFPGGVVLSDDYAGYSGHDAQRQADAMSSVRTRGVRVFSLPTGHGLLLKPYTTGRPAP